ncbi:MAG: hypothetical protein ACR2F2_01665 [Pyrinomonadaceae bacterium]
MKKLSLFLLIPAIWILPFAVGSQIFAHGGEDHGDEKPKVASEKGTVTRTARLGDYELTFKHPFLEPDTGSGAKLFVTKFKTNEAVEEAQTAIEIESANGSVTEAVIEKTDIAGSYNVKIPALPQGVYSVRAKLTYNGETDTATFSGVEVNLPPIVSPENSMSWARTALIGFVFALVLVLFGGLVYFVWNYADGESLNEETVSV